MKKSIITEIYYGNKGHKETVAASKEYLKVMNEMSKLTKTLNEKLGEQEKDLLTKLEFCFVELEAETALTNFTEGIKTGLQLGKEVFG